MNNDEKPKAKHFIVKKNMEIAIKILQTDRNQCSHLCPFYYTRVKIIKYKDIPYNNMDIFCDGYCTLFDKQRVTSGGLPPRLHEEEPERINRIRLSECLETFDK